MRCASSPMSPLTLKDAFHKRQRMFIMWVNTSDFKSAVFFFNDEKAEQNKICTFDSFNENTRCTFSVDTIYALRGKLCQKIVV